MNKERIIVGLSGGVDSSVAALLLQEQGHQVEGLFMHNWDAEDDDYCTAAEDFQDAQRVADELNIPLHKVNFAAEYRDRVFEYFLAEHQAGRTPNPDVLCNREIKFGAFLHYALALGADAIATGHYVASEQRNSEWRLLEAADQDKDQSYFLHTITQEQLSRSRFPLGKLKKPVVRQIAEEAGFVNFAKKDSTGICFIGERDFREFLAQYLPAKPGAIHNLDGKEIGQHQGAMYYTIGQRQGLGIGGVRGASSEPWFVAGKNIDKNILYAVQGHKHPALLSRSLRCGQIHWVAGQPPESTYCSAKVRYRHQAQSCQIHPLDNGDWAVEFDTAQRAVTPGQWVVFYANGACLGGGVIEATQA